MYKHASSSSKAIPMTASKVLCVGRNYAAHAKELGNEVPTEPILFIKPNSALCHFSYELELNSQFGEIHYETEIAILLQKPLKNASIEEASKAIWGFGLALDLTRRDLQTQLKEKGQPWEKAKAFDGACPVTEFFEAKEFSISEIHAEAFLNDKKVQTLNSIEMLWKIPELLVYMSRFFSLSEGDVVLTGTPQGVGKLAHNDEIKLVLKNKCEEPIFSQSSRVKLL